MNFNIKAYGKRVIVLILAGLILLIGILVLRPQKQTISQIKEPVEAQKPKASSGMDSASVGVSKPELINQNSDSSLPGAITQSNSTTALKAPPVDRDEKNPSLIAATPRLHGSPVYAQIKIGDQTTELVAGETRQFDRIKVARGEKMQLQITYPEGEAGQTVAVEVKDGGKLDNNSVAKVVQLDENKRLSFGFQVSMNRGIHHVLLRNGAEQTLLAFWAGEPLPLALH